MRIAYKTFFVIFLQLGSMLYLFGHSKSIEITSKVTSSELIITNHTSKEIYYKICANEMLELLEWVPICTRENQIIPKQSIHIPMKSLSLKSSKKATVFWWHKGKYFMDKNNYGPDESGVKSFTIKIE